MLKNKNIKTVAAALLIFSCSLANAAVYTGRIGFEPNNFYSGDWNFEDDFFSYAQVNNESSYSGENSLLIYNEDHWMGYVTLNLWPYVSTSDIAEFSFWARSDRVLGSSVELFYTDNSYQELYFGADWFDTSWKYFNFTQEIDQGKNLSLIRFHTASERDYYDDIVVSYNYSPVQNNSPVVPVTPSVPEPSTIALLALGFAGIGIARRSAGGSSKRLTEGLIAR